MRQSFHIEHEGGSLLQPRFAEASVLIPGDGASSPYGLYDGALYKGIDTALPER